MISVKLLSVWLMQSVLGKMNEIAKHKAAIEDAETQNKVSFFGLLFYGIGLNLENYKRRILHI